jgi:hypothetical protein
LPFGPTHIPPERFGGTYGGSFNGTQISAVLDNGADCLIPYLEAARQAHMRVFINLTGNEQFLRDANGFSLTKWKTRVDRFRGDSIEPYIADGTILAHLLVDEPNDKGNWSGKTVPLPDIEEMARYSKEIWPDMATYIRTKPDFLIGYSYPDLDALWFHYLPRFGPIDQFITEWYGQAHALGLVVIGGLNILNGGDPSTGIPGKEPGRFAMSPDMIRSFGEKLLEQPGQCAFLLWEWQDALLARPDIKAAIDELGAKARAYPAASCHKQ